MDADRNGAVFTTSASSAASRKLATLGLKQQKGHSSLTNNTSSHNVRATTSQFRSESHYRMRHPPRSYPGNKTNLCRPVRLGLIPPLGYCIRSPTSARKMYTKTFLRIWTFNVTQSVEFSNWTVFLDYRPNQYSHHIYNKH